MSTIKPPHVCVALGRARPLGAQLQRRTVRKTKLPARVDEEAVKKLTGQAQVPVLLVNGTVIRLDRHLELA